MTELWEGSKWSLQLDRLWFESLPIGCFMMVMAADRSYKSPVSQSDTVLSPCSKTSVQDVVPGTCHDQVISDNSCSLIGHNCFVFGTS